MGYFEEICLGRGKGLGLGNLRIEMGQRDRSKKPLFSPGVSIDYTLPILKYTVDTFA